MTELTPTFAQVPYNKALNRIEQGSQSLNELITIMNERKEIEEKSVLYSAKISKSNIFEYEIDNSTNERVLGYFKNYYLYLSRVQIKNHKEINDIIIRNLDELRTERNKVVDKYKAIISNCMKDVTSAEELLDKAKKNYVKSSKDYQLATNKLVASEIACEEWKKSMENKKLLQQQQGKSDKTNFSMGRIISAFESTPENDRDKQNKKVIKKKCEMASSFDQITEKKRNLIEKISAIDDSIAKANKEFQAIEQDRLDQLKITMKRFCEIEQSKLKAQLELISNFEQIVDSSSSVDDINLYIDQEKQPELTHKYTNALELLDIVYNDRSIQESEEKQISVVENDIKNLVVHSSVDSASANQHNSEIESPVATAILMKSLKSIGTEVVSANLEDDLVSAMNDEGVLNESVEDRELSANEQLEFLNDEISSKAMVLRAIMHQVLVTNDTKESSIMSEDEWRDMLSQQELRDVVLQELDEQRGRHSLLKSNSYESLTNAMKVMLDFCYDENDLKSAMRITNMANTFHKKIEENGEESYLRIGPISDVPRAPDKVEIGSPKIAYKRKYIQREHKIYEHPLWRKQGFWGTTLIESTLAQMRMTQPVLWDELNQDELRETVIGIHNILFGQLGTLAFTMLDLGLSKEEVEENVVTMSRRCQLIEEQEFELVRSIRGISPVRSGVKGSFDSFSALASNSVVSTSIQALSIDGALTVVKEDRIIATTTIASNTGASQTDSKASLSSALDAEMVSKKDEDDEYYAVL